MSVRFRLKDLDDVVFNDTYSKCDEDLYTQPDEMLVSQWHHVAFVFKI